MNPILLVPPAAAVSAGAASVAAGAASVAVGAASVAALLSGRYVPSGPVAVIASGGNVDDVVFARFLEG